MLSYHFIEPDPDMDQEPVDGDYIIMSRPFGPNELARVNGRSCGSFRDENEMCSFIMEKMEEEGFYPNVWYQNERGAVDLCIIKEEE